MVHLLGFIWAFVQLRADGRERLADELAEAGVIDAEREELAADPGSGARTERGRARPSPASRSSIGPATCARAGRRGPAAARAAVEPELDPGRERARLWLRERFGQRPVVPDRSAALAHERGGRFDKLDLWLLVVLVVATLVLRTFRLGEPLNMHFDEVYHARTATEFLQDWRYGDESNIYEWTHPHLGKYLIAAGITAFGDDRVSATGSIDAPVNDALVEPRHTDIATGDQTGARLWLATDTGIRGYDLGSRAEVARYDLGPTGALAHDPTASQLFAATETGELYTLDLAQIDIGGAESVEPFEVADLGVPVDRMVVAEDGTTVLAIAGDRLLVVDSVTGEVTLDTERPGLVEAADVGSGSAVVASPASIDDPAAVAGRLAELLGGDATELEAQLASGEERVTIGGLGNGEQTDVEDAIDAGELPGIEIVPVEQVLVADGDGVAFLDRATGDELWAFPLEGGAHGLASITGIDDEKYYATAGTEDKPTYAVVELGQDTEDKGPSIANTYPLPGLGSRIGYDEPLTAGAHPRQDAGRERIHGLRRRATRERRLRRRAPPVRPLGVGLRHRRGTPGRRPPAAPGVRGGRERGDGRDRSARVQLADARGDRRRADGAVSCTCSRASSSGGGRWPCWPACSRWSTACCSRSRGSR